MLHPLCPLERHSEAQNFQLLLEGETPRAEHAQQQVPGREQGGTLKHGQATVSFEKMDGQVLLKSDTVQRSDSRKEAKRRMVATHEDVLAVIHHAARCGIKKGARPPTQVRLLFEQAHTAPRFCQGDSRRQARKTAADDQDFAQETGFRSQDSGFKNQKPNSTTRDILP
jgi:hypothetical protein